MRLVVVGGTGLIGSRLVEALVSRGVDAVPAALETGLNTITGEGLKEALEGASAVVDVSNAPPLEGDAARSFFHTSTDNLLAAGVRAGVGHYVVLSVVGATGLAESAYFQGKLVQERLVAASPIPHSIVHATQFFEFLPRIADAMTVGDAVHLPHVLMQPASAGDIASAIGDVVLGDPSDGIVEIAGPEPLHMEEVMRRVLRATDDARDVIVDPRARYFGAVLRERSLLPGEGAIRCATRLEDWLQQSFAPR